LNNETKNNSENLMDFKVLAVDGGFGNNGGGSGNKATKLEDPSYDSDHSQSNGNNSGLASPGETARR